MVVSAFLAGAFATLLITDGSVIGVAIFLVFWIIGSERRADESNRCC